MIAPGVAGVADIVKIEAIDVITADDVHADVVGVFLDLRMAWIKRVAHTVPGRAGGVLRQPVGMGIVGMGRCRVGGGERGLIPPNLEADNPGMNIDPLFAAGGVVRLGDHVLQGIKSRGADVRCLWLVDAPAVVGVPPLPDLRHDHVRVRIADVLDHGRDLRRGLESRAEGIRPEGPIFRLLGGGEAGQESNQGCGNALNQPQGNQARTTQAHAIQ